MNFFIYLKNVMIVNFYCPCNNRKCVYLTDKYKDFCEEDNMI